MPEMSGGEAVIQALRAEGVETVFGIPGLHNLALYDAMLRFGTPRHILARHEQGAAFMADGYARASGRVGVCLATTGPGASNTLTAVAESYASGIPTLVIMSDIPSPLLGLKMGALHEIPDQIRLFEPVTAWGETIREVSAIPHAIHRAFEWLRTRRPRPIALSIPTDLLAERAECLIQQGKPGVRPPADPNLIAQAADLLRRAQRPAVLVGGGVIASEASVEVQAVCERLQAPVITTIMGRGAIPDTSPLVIAVLPNKENSLPVLHSADVILAVGTRFAYRATQSRPVPLQFSPEQTLIHVDLDPAEVGKMYQPTLGIVGDAKQVLQGLLEALEGVAPAAGWDWAWLHSWRGKPLSPYGQRLQRALEDLRGVLPDDAIVVGDQAAINYWMAWYFPVLKPRTFLYPVGTGTLGYGLPAAIGAKVARPDTPVVAVVGDGGFLFTCQELATVVKYRLDLPILLFNDNSFGAIKWLQERFFQRTGEVELTNPDFQAFGFSFGVPTVRVGGLDEIPEAVVKALSTRGPTLIEVPMAIDPPWQF